MKGNHKGEAARALPVFLRCAAPWHAFVLRQASVLQHVFGAPRGAHMGTWHKPSLPGTCCKWVSSSDVSFEKQKKKDLPMQVSHLFPRRSDCPLIAPWAAAANGPSILSPSKVSWRIAAPDAASTAFGLVAFWQQLPVGAPCDASVHRE